MALNLAKRLLGIYHLVWLMWISLRYHVAAFFSNARDPLAQGFASLYAAIDKDFYAHEEADTPVPKLVSHVKGVVLELGPGTGNQMLRMDRSQLSRVTAVEVNPVFIATLQSRAAELGLDDIYHPVLGSVSDAALLKSHGLGPGTVDTVLSVQVLCSVDDLDATARVVYDLLKPGGEFIFWEHQRSSDTLTAWTQWLFNFAWSPLIGGCILDRNIKAALIGVGDWQISELEIDNDPEAILPRVWGRLIKK